MKQKLLLLPMLISLLSGCALIPIEPSDNGQTSNNPSDQTTSSDSQSEVTTSGTTTSEEEEDYIYVEDTSTPEIDPSAPKMHSGFSYPKDAQTKVTEEYVEFWHPDTKITINISGDPNMFQLMDEHGLGYDDASKNRFQDLYWPVTVDLTINGKAYHYEEVGMRRKGNTSRSYRFMEGDRVSDAFSFKLSFNETWDKDIYAQFGLKKSWLPTDPDYIERDDRTIVPNAQGKGGLDKIDIKMFKTNDESLVNQPFAFSLFQKYGLIAPNSTLANIRFKSGSNESNMGVATVNEPIDKDLLKRYFSKENAKGDLYKVGWAYGDKGNLSYEQYLQNPGMIAEEDKYEMIYPRYDAKEFDDKASEPHKNLVNLMKVLYENRNKTQNQYSRKIEEVVDMTSFLNFAALSYLTGNQDDMRNNGNNYYIYFNPGKNNKAYFIPYDYDWAVGLGYDGNGGLNMAKLSPFHSKLQGNGRNPQDNLLFLYTIIKTQDKYKVDTNTQWRQAYYNRLQTILNDGYFTLATFTDLYNCYSNTYKNDTNVLAMHSHEVYNSFVGVHLFTEYLSEMTKSINNYAPTN